jgi:tetratricopeptide (TPR) repeat protein
VDYRDPAHLKNYEEAREKTEKLDPTLLGDRLATIDALLLFHVKQPDRTEENVAQVLKDTEGKHDDPVALTFRAKACRSAAVALEKDSPERSEQLRQEAIKGFQRAFDLVPDSYEVGVELLTVLVGEDAEGNVHGTTETLKQAGGVAYQLVERMGNGKRAYFCDEQGPELMLFTVRVFLNPEDNPGLLELSKEWMERKDVPEFLYGQTVQDWSSLELIERAELDEKFLRGYNKMLLLKKYYKLAANHGAKKEWNQALEVYAKVATISPAYAQLEHFN